MTEAETRVKSEGTDEESIVFEANVSESALVEASAPVVSSGILIKEACGSDSNSVPSATVTVNVTEESLSVITKEMGDNKEQAVEGEAVDERTKKGASSNPASSKEEKIAVVDKVENTISKEKGKKEVVPGEKRKANTINKKAKRLQKMKTAASADTETTEANKEKTDMAEGAPSKEEGNKEVVLDEVKKGNQEMKTTDLTIAAASAAVTTEAAKDDGKKEEMADKERVDRPLNKKNKKRNKRNKTRVAAAEAAGAAEVGAAKKLSVEKDHAGMIFMCSTETKKDCYRYKVFGMPAGKKEAVAEVYKGMKLFLYDIDLKLLYGMYIATSKGGYNIQPKAFKSAFPSQVRFKVLKDYLPLPEEKFKAAIKANYYQKKKFSLELSAEQVKNLSKLFAETTKASKSKRTNGRATRERVPRDFTSHDTKRRRFEGTVSRRPIDEADRTFPRSRDIYERESYAPQVPLQVLFPPHGSAVLRQAPLPLYPSPPRLSTLPPPPPGYVYERPIDVNYYRRELPTEAHGYGVIDPEGRLPLDHVVHNDPYGLHREPAPYNEARYSLTLPSGYHAAAPPPYRY